MAMRTGWAPCCEGHAFFVQFHDIGCSHPCFLPGRTSLLLGFGSLIAYYIVSVMYGVLIRKMESIWMTGLCMVLSSTCGIIDIYRGCNCDDGVSRKLSASEEEVDRVPFRTSSMESQPGAEHGPPQTPVRSMIQLQATPRLGRRRRHRSSK